MALFRGLAHLASLVAAYGGTSVRTKLSLSFGLLNIHSYLPTARHPTARARRRGCAEFGKSENLSSQHESMFTLRRKCVWLFVIVHSSSVHTVIKTKISLWSFIISTLVFQLIFSRLSLLITFFNHCYFAHKHNIQDVGCVRIYQMSFKL